MNEIFPDHMTDDEQEFQKICVEMFMLFRKKNHDYADSWRKSGLIGVAEKIKTKSDRLITVSADGFQAKVNEQPADTLMDCANYSVLGLILAREHPRKMRRQ